MNGQGVTFAGGLGEIMADWIIEGKPKVSVARIDVSRFLPLHSNPEYLYQRVPEIASNVFKVISWKCNNDL
jgi:4-methylaminobutanoate oxidase (formaldehyde-forming)